MYPCSPGACRRAAGCRATARQPAVILYNNILYYHYIII